MRQSNVLLIKLLCLYLSVATLPSLTAQNVGVGTISPTAILHIKGAPDTITVLYESFEAGLGDFTNAGTVNWSTTNAFPPISGLQVATSNIVYAGQDAILQLVLNLPVGAHATLRFHDRVEIGSGIDGLDHAEASFSIDGEVQWAHRQAQVWTEKV
ncbi:MAG: hypothetical protein R3301_07315, partial [Saprospiraceae bacterium]|nr:hypothetical protein [Saprospiraceae bacterium]